MMCSPPPPLPPLPQVGINVVFMAFIMVIAMVFLMIPFMLQGLGLADSGWYVLGG